jgi:hypothetical protein
MIKKMLIFMVGIVGSISGKATIESLRFIHKVDASKAQEMVKEALTSEVLPDVDYIIIGHIVEVYPQLTENILNLITLNNLITIKPMVVRVLLKADEKATKIKFRELLKGADEDFLVRVNPELVEMLALAGGELSNYFEDLFNKIIELRKEKQKSEEKNIVEKNEKDKKRSGTILQKINSVFSPRKNNGNGNKK